jgi:GH43 family beta-xylosidase
VTSFRNPVISGSPGSDHGDPFIIKYLDSFYLYHTGETHGRRGVSVHVSRDLVDWEFKGYALEAAESGWAFSDLWAPEVVYERGTFSMYVTATHRFAGGQPQGLWQQGEGDDSGRRLGLARSQSPLGPFVLDDRPLLDSWSIDGHPFRDDDGTMWFFYNLRDDRTAYVDGTPGTGIAVDRLLAPDRLAGEPTLALKPTQRWEGLHNGHFYWNEAPFVLKRRDTYYQMYSGGFFLDASYAIGMAEARAPRGPWHKYDHNPVLKGGERILGPGHHSFVFGPDVATRYAVYHGYVAGEEGRKVHIDRLLWAGDRPVIAGPTEGEQPRPPAPVHDAQIPHWRAEAWVRGSWVEVQGIRFELAPEDVWHQIEVVQADGRFAVRAGGVLRASYPVATPGGPRFGTGGELQAETVTSYLEDGNVHELPSGSSYVWRWGGAGGLELTLAVKGTIELSFDGDSRRLEGRPDRYRLVRLERDEGASEIVVAARDAAATVTDMTVHAR